MDLIIKSRAFNIRKGVKSTMEATTLAGLTAEQQEAALGGAAVGGIIGIGAGMIFAFLIILWIFQIIAYWKLFTKAGEPGWKSIIPVYNSYIQYKISWKPMWFWISFVALFVLNLLNQFSDPAQAPSTFLIIITVIVLILNIVIQVMTALKLSRAFGHGVGYAIGLIFL